MFGDLLRRVVFWRGHEKGEGESRHSWVLIRRAWWSWGNVYAREFLIWLGRGWLGYLDTDKRRTLCAMSRWTWSSVKTKSFPRNWSSKFGWIWSSSWSLYAWNLASSSRNSKIDSDCFFPFHISNFLLASRTWLKHNTVSYSLPWIHASSVYQHFHVYCLNSVHQWTFSPFLSNGKCFKPVNVNNLNKEHKMYN